MLAFRILLTVLTLAMIAGYLGSRPRLDFTGLEIRWDRLALALGLTLPLLWLRALKWQIILRGLAPAVTVGEALRSYLGSMALALVTPGRVGELSRGMYLPHPAVQGWKGAGLVLIDSWTDFLAVALWAGLGYQAASGAGGLLAGLAVAALLAPIPLWLRLVPPVLSRLPSRRGLREWAARALPAPGDVPGGDLALASASGVAAYGLEWLQMLFLIQGLVPADPPYWHLAGIMALVALANSVQITLAGLGVREGMALLLLAGIGIGPEAAVSAAFLQSVLILFLPAALGLPFKPVALSAAPASVAGHSAGPTTDAGPPTDSGRSRGRPPAR